MVYNNFQCKKLSSFFKSSAVSTAGAEEASAVMAEVAVRTGISLTSSEDSGGGAGREGGVDAAAPWHAKTSPAEVLMRYRDAVACRIAHGRPFPAGLDAELFRKVNGAATRAICGAFQGGVDAPPETRKLALGLATGRFLHHILDVMEYSASPANDRPPWALIDNHPQPEAGSISPKMFLYSGHDWTLMPLLMALRPRYGLSSDDGANSKWADFAADLAFEAYVEGAGAEREIWCRVLFKGKVIDLPVSEGRADGVCSVKALRGWFAGEGLLMGDVKRWNELCKAG